MCFAQACVTADGNGRLELFEYIHPNAKRRNPPDRTRSACTALPSRSMTSTRLSRLLPRTGCHALRGVATYEDVYKLTYVRGPSGIIVMLAEELKKS